MTICLKYNGSAGRDVSHIMGETKKSDCNRTLKEKSASLIADKIITKQIYGNFRKNKTGNT